MSSLTKLQADSLLEGDGTVRRGLGFWLAYTVGWLLYSGLIVSASMAEGHPLPRSLVAVVVTAGPAILLGTLVAVRRRDFFRPDRSLLEMAGLHAVTATVFAVASTVLCRLLISWLPTGLAADGEWAEIPFVFHLITYYFLYVLLAGFLMWTESIARVQESRAAAAREAALRAQAEARAIRAQFNPHFVFNTLHSLMLLVRADPSTAERAIEDVAALIRYASRLQREERDAVPLHEEIDFARRYLALEELRLEDRLTVEWRVDEALLGARVPAFSLQTLLENAVKHGVAPRPEGGTILVQVAARGDLVELTVEDDGEGAHLEAVHDSDGQGLTLLEKRLGALYGDAATLEWETADTGGFRVSLRVPHRSSPGGPESERKVTGAEASVP